MKIEDLVLTIDQAKHLQELGLDMSDSAFFWFYVKGNKFAYELVSRESLTGRVVMHQKKFYDIIPTYTLQEILDKLPRTFDINRYIDSDEISFMGSKEIYGESFYHTIETDKGLLSCAYDMLCWLIENGYLKS